MTDTIPIGKKRGTRWLFFWENIVLPLNIVSGIIWLIIGFQPVSLIILALVLATIIGLKKRKLWGWYLNFVLLVVGTLNYPFYLHGKDVRDYELYSQVHEALVKTGDRDAGDFALSPPELTAEDFLLPFGITAIMILLPSAIYFGKRKYLFDGSDAARASPAEQSLSASERGQKE
ncbi:MAG: hypothetical protein WC602_06475 [archaeon]